MTQTKTQTKIIRVSNRRALDDIHTLQEFNVDTITNLYMHTIKSNPILKIFMDKINEYPVYHRPTDLLIDHMMEIEKQKPSLLYTHIERKKNNLALARSLNLDMTEAMIVCHDVNKLNNNPEKIIIESMNRILDTLTDDHHQTFKSQLPEFTLYKQSHHPTPEELLKRQTMTILQSRNSFMWMMLRTELMLWLASECLPAKNQLVVLGGPCYYLEADLYHLDNADLIDLGDPLFVHKQQDKIKQMINNYHEGLITRYQQQGYTLNKQDLTGLYGTEL